MKTKPPKLKRSDPIELEGGITIVEITKNRFGWFAHSKCHTEAPTEPCLQTSNPLTVILSQEDFDRLQPGDTIKFLAVVTRPRKVKADPKLMPLQPGEETISTEQAQTHTMFGNES